MISLRLTGKELFGQQNLSALNRFLPTVSSGYFYKREVRKVYSARRTTRPLVDYSQPALFSEQIVFCQMFVVLEYFANAYRLAT